jgi:UBX domain-containing protein 1
LGSDDVPSETISDPHATVPAPLPTERREFHIWDDGFSIDDGPLYRYDDPANTRYIELINRGQAPLELMDVQRGQEVDVQLNIHRGEKFVQPKKKYKPFSGQGQRLGSPTPGASASSSTATSSTASTSQAGSASAGTSVQPGSISVDNSQPTITLQIRLADGTRLRSSFNTTHTIGDVYSFVNASNVASARGRYALMTTFPSKELTDKAQALSDIAELKRGGVVVQKWT